MFGNTKGLPYQQSFSTHSVHPPILKPGSPSSMQCEKQVLVPRPPHLVYQKQIVYDKKFVQVPVVRENIKKVLVPKSTEFIRKVQVPIVVWTTYPIRTTKVNREPKIVKEPELFYQNHAITFPRITYIPRVCQPKPIRICIPGDCCRNYSIGAPNFVNIHSSNENKYKSQQQQNKYGYNGYNANNGNYRTRGGYSANNYGGYGSGGKTGNGRIYGYGGYGGYGGYDGYGKFYSSPRLFSNMKTFMFNPRISGISAFYL